MSRETTNKPFAVSLDVGGSLLNKTGSWRSERPVYVDRLPPCNHACPAGEDIQGWLYRAEEGDYRGAWESLITNNPLPAIMGRACYHPCQDACNRAQLDQAVNIHAVERFLGDLALQERWPVPLDVPASGKRVLVIGAGPSGLSAAYHLARFGHEVEIHEAGPLPGGMMRFGIPRYRLPREIVDGEVRRIADMGVKLNLDSRVDDIPEALERGGFDACFAAIGAHVGKRVDIPGPDAARIVDAVSFLRGMENGEAALQLGRRVVVYGGGNTAVDVARTAKRLGAEPVIVYRRGREQMSAHEFEIDEALEEGVVVNWLRTITAADEQGFRVEKMALDENGWPQPTGEFETIEADSLVLALGQNVDQGILTSLPGVELNPDGVVEVGADMSTAYPGVFAGGDMVPSERTVTVAVGHGKKAARNIDAWLRGETRAAPPKHELVSFDMLNTWYYTDAAQQVQPVLDAARRASTFDEVHEGLDAGNALFEARRCLSCGNCFECDNCYGICPDNAIVKLGPGRRFEFKYDYCKGCGMCAAECPCGAILMTPELT
ncbi:MAG: NAD(P)-binding protein [Gammaproteobacteria bacterium]|jgi:NADPH-dependent glutamate synthase beta subunit-like oxidoreductase/Pyruvate/2-oxoacid:ferredoxin oxidoreductase delta subunit